MHLCKDEKRKKIQKRNIEKIISHETSHLSFSCDATPPIDGERDI